MKLLFHSLNLRGRRKEERAHIPCLTLRLSLQCRKSKLNSFFHSHFRGNQKEKAEIPFLLCESIFQFSMINYACLFMSLDGLKRIKSWWGQVTGCTWVEYFVNLIPYDPLTICIVQLHAFQRMNSELHIHFQFFLLIFAFVV